MVKRFDIFLLDLGSDGSGASGGGGKQTRPCVVVSPDELNGNISSVIIAPIDAARNKYPTRVEIEFLNKKRSIVLEQIRTVDKSRLTKKVGELESAEQAQVLSVLHEMFAP
jgi:mRNA interferase MazF